MDGVTTNGAAVHGGMLHCVTPEQVRAHLPRLVKGRGHWVFFTDDADAHAEVAGVALAALFERRFTVLDDVKMGVMDLVHVERRFAPAPISWLALPKDKVPAAYLSELLRRLGWPDLADAMGAGGDLIPVHTGKSDVDRLIAFAASVEDGSFRCTHADAN